MQIKKAQKTLLDKELGETIIYSEQWTTKGTLGAITSLFVCLDEEEIQVIQILCKLFFSRICFYPWCFQVKANTIFIYKITKMVPALIGREACLHESM